MTPPRLISRLRPWSVLLPFCLVLIVNTALGQSLSIIRNGERPFTILAAAPPDTRYVLQESANLHLWVDSDDVVEGQLSLQFDNAGVTRHFFRLTPWTPPAPPIIIMLIGDSTVADFISNDSRFNGWGQGIYGFFKPNARVLNLAYPCYSTWVFLTSAEKDKMLLVKPNYVLVQFGLINAVGNAVGCFASPPDAYLTSLQRYEDDLRTIVQTIRGFNGTPILITPPSERVFDDQGKVSPTLQNHSAIVKHVAAELRTPLIDLNQLSMDLYNQLGESGSAYISMGAGDIAHYSDKGAQVIAELVVNALPDSLGTYLVGVFNPPPKR